MSEPVSPLVQMLLALERRAAFWRGAAAGAGAVLALLAALAVLLLATPARAQEIPRAAHEVRRDLTREARAAWGIAAPVATFAAQIHQESAYRPDARSRVGALGLAQFMPATADWIREAYPDLLGQGDPLNPRWAIRALVVYDRHLWERIRALDGCERMAFALAAYNGGLGHVYTRQQMSPHPAICLGATCDIRPPRVSPANQRENAGYSRRILLVLEPIYHRAGFGPGACTGRPA